MHLKIDRKWWILFVTTTASSLFLVDTTILPVAIPIIEKEFAFSQVGVIWVVNAYLLSLAMLLLIGGRLAEIFGYRFIYNLGLVIFGVGSVLGATCGGDTCLIWARTIQGVGSGLTYPASLSLIIAVFPLKLRARAIGIDTGVASLFMMLGPVIGGVLTQYFSWRYIFWMNVPFVIFGIGMSFWLLKGNEKKQEPFPWFSSLLMMGGVFALIFGIMEGNQYGWHSFWTLACIIAGPMLLSLFVWVSLKIEHPLTDFRFFKNKLFLGTNIARFWLYILVGASVLWIIYFEKELAYTPLEVGVLILIGCTPVIAMAPVAGYLADRFGARLPLTIGFLLIIFSMIWLISFYSAQNILVYLPGLLAFGAGMPLVMSPSIAIGLSCVSAKKLGSAAGLMITLKQFASTIGIALMTAIYYGTHTRVGNYSIAFAAVAVASLICAIIGFIFTMLLVKRPPASHQPHNH